MSNRPWWPLLKSTCAFGMRVGVFARKGLHKSNMKTLAKAEKPERDALDALQKIRPAGQP